MSEVAFWQMIYFIYVTLDLIQMCANKYWERK